MAIAICKKLRISKSTLYGYLRHRIGVLKLVLIRKTHYKINVLLNHRCRAQIQRSVVL